MELRQLSYFTTIVNEGNISQAAKKLNISQPPLSHQMKLLEAELGVTLFERGSRRIRLTPAGKTFYDRALAILDLSQAARTELTAQKQEIQGVVRLGIISSAVEFVTRHYLAPFRRAYPKALFELHESNSYHLLDLLHSNQIDLAVIRTPFAKAGLEMQTLPPEAFLAIGREMIWSHYKECPNALLTDIPASEPQKSHTPTSLPLSALTRAPLILYRRWQPLILGYFEEQALEPNIVCIADDARTALLWASEGLGIALAPESALCLNSDPALIRRIITQPQIHSSICLVKRKERSLSLVGNAFFPKFPCHQLFHKEGADSLLLRQKQPQLLPIHRRKIRPLPPMKRKKSAVNEPIFVYCRCFYASFVPLFFRSRITRTTISAANPTPVPTQPLAVIPAAR